jgi:hypothetical protein
VTIDDEPIAGRVLLGEHASGCLLAARNASDGIPVIGVWNAVTSLRPRVKTLPTVEAIVAGFEDLARIRTSAADCAAV